MLGHHQPIPLIKMLAMQHFHIATSRSIGESSIAHFWYDPCGQTVYVTMHIRLLPATPVVVMLYSFLSIWCL